MLKYSIDNNLILDERLKILFGCLCIHGDLEHIIYMLESGIVDEINLRLSYNKYSIGSDSIYNHYSYSFLNGNFALEIALYYKRINVIKYLLLSSYVNEFFKKKVMQLACKNNDLDLIKCLITKETDIEDTDYMNILGMYNHVEIPKYLVELHGKDVLKLNNYCLFKRGIRFGHIELFKYIMKEIGQDCIESSYNIGCGFKQSINILEMIAIHGKLEMLIYVYENFSVNYSYNKDILFTICLNEKNFNILQYIIAKYTKYSLPNKHILKLLGSVDCSSLIYYLLNGDRSVITSYIIYSVHIIGYSDIVNRLLVDEKKIFDNYLYYMTFNCDINRFYIGQYCNYKKIDRSEKFSDLKMICC